ncbi:hypothetical protein Btru_017042 [Bulinus truncatus]|nr:hypothetical protein Btru_017042 [Bulinus truncatus]
MTDMILYMRGVKLHVDVSGSNIQHVVETILDKRDKNEKKRSPPKEKLKNYKSASIEVVPTTIHGRGDKVAILFTEEIKGEITVNFKGIKEESYGLSGKEELDKKLADHFNKSLCSDGKASKILDEILDSPLTESIDEKNKYPTILHWAAANGLSNQSQDVYEIMQPSRAGAPMFTKEKEKASPPPLPTSRPPNLKKQTEQTSEDDNIYIQPDEALTLAPPISKPMTLPRAAVGSRSQTELIRIQEEVRNGTFSIQEAEMLFKAWKERYETGNAVSFKERQQTLQTLRNAHNKTFDLFKEAKQKKKKKIIKEDSFTAEISEPFAMRPTNKFTSGRDSNASTTSSQSSISRTSSDSGRDSSDSHLFSSSDDIDEKRISTKDMYIVLRDYPEVNNLTPPPLPPPRITLARPTTIKAVPGKPEPDNQSSRNPPVVAPKPKTPSVKK